MNRPRVDLDLRPYFKGEERGHAVKDLIVCHEGMEGGGFNASLMVWHNAGSDLTINDAEITVHRMQRVFDTDYNERP
jgi:hypothetical protein